MNTHGLKVYHLFVVAIFAGLIPLLASSALAQNLFELNSSGNTNIYKFTPDGKKSAFAVDFPSPGIGLAFNGLGTLFAGSLSGNIYDFPPGGAQNAFSSFSPYDIPFALAADNAGNLYVGDGNDRIYKFTPQGGQTTFASGLNGSSGLAFDKAGDLFEADSGSGNIYEFTNSSGTLSSNPTLFASGLSEPVGLAFDGAGVLYVANNVTNGSITKITTSGVTNTFVSGLNSPWGLAFDSAGNLFEADSGSGNIFKFTPTGSKSTFASGLQPSLIAFQPVPQLQAALAGKSCSVTVTMPSPYFSTVLQASANLSNWSSIYTNTPPFTYTNDCSCPHCFYRIMLGP